MVDVKNHDLGGRLDDWCNLLAGVAGVAGVLGNVLVQSDVLLGDDAREM